MKAIRRKNGEIMFACPNKHWSYYFYKWQQDTTKPCPMPEHHLMFDGKNDFCYEIVEHFELEI